MKALIIGLLLMTSAIAGDITKKEITFTVTDKGKKVTIKLIGGKDSRTKTDVFRSIEPTSLDFLMRVKEQLPCEKLSYFRHPLDSETWIFFCEKKLEE